MDYLRNILFKATAGNTTDFVKVEGYDFNKGLDYPELIRSFSTTGFQATNLGLAMDSINRMLAWRLSDEPVVESDSIIDPEERAKTKCRIFFAYTSNMVSCDIREIIKYLVQHNLVDVLVTSAGGIEEDFIKFYETSARNRESAVWSNL